MGWYWNILMNRYAMFHGRENRPAFINFMNISMIIIAVVGIVDTIANTHFLNIFFFILLVPFLAFGSRRLHDTNRSGWRQLILLIPIVGIFFVLFWYLQEGKDEKNRFGSQTST